MGFETETKPPNLRGRAASKWYSDRNLTPPTRQDKAPRRTRRPKASRGKIQTQIFAGTMLLQTAALAAIDVKYHEDALTLEEAYALSDALADEVMGNAWLLKAFSQLDKVGPHGKLAMVLASIALPRMAKYGVIPRELEPTIRSFAATSLSMGAGSAHDADRGHGIGEVNTSVDPAQTAFEYTDLPVQSGQGEVRNGHHNANDPADDEPEVLPNRAPATAEAD